MACRLWTLAPRPRMSVSAAMHGTVNVAYVRMVLPAGSPRDHQRSNMTTEAPEVITSPNCDECGEAGGTGKFCPSCGHPRAAASVDADDAQTTEDTVVMPVDDADEVDVDERSAPLVTPLSKSRGHRKLLIAAIAVVILLVVGVLILAAVRRSDRDEATNTHRERLAAIFGPVLGANEEVSDELGKLRGTNPTEALAAVGTAKDETTRAKGALSSLSTPEGSGSITKDAQQVLDREESYLAAVEAVLLDPSSPTLSQLATLESNLTTAFSAAGPSVAGESDSVRGVQTLVRWAPSAVAAKARARAIRVREAAARRRAAARTAATATAAATSVAPTSAFGGNGTDCGGGLVAGPRTSCPFAAIVRTAYFDAPGSAATVNAYSPVTGQTYVMNCAPAGSGITCSGGNNASVAFTW